MADDLSGMSNEDLLRAYQAAPEASPLSAPPTIGDGGGDLSSMSNEDLLRAYQAPAPQDVSAGMALSGIPIAGAYVPQAEAAIRALAHPFTGVGAPGETIAERYAANLPERQAQYAQAQQESPLTSAALQIGGGMAALAPLGATALGLRALGLTGGLVPRVIASGASGAGISAADALARGQDPGTAAMIGGGLGLAAPAIGAAARRVITPITPRGGAERAAAVQNLQNEGVNLTAGQITGYRPLQYLESSVGDVTGAGSRQIERGQEQFTAAALRRAGIDSDRATPDVIDKAFTRIGGRFDQLAARNTLQGDQQVGADLGTALKDYVDIVGQPNRAPAIGKYFQEIVDAFDNPTGTISGETYQNLRSRLETTARNAGYEQSGLVADTLRDMKDALDSAMERSMVAAGSPDLGLWQQVRRQYRNILPIERAATGAGEGAATGLISPSALRNAVVAQGRRAYARGTGDFAELARSGEAVMKPLPQSGTAPRHYMTTVLPTSLGSIGLGLATGNPALVGAGIAGVAGPPLAGGALMSRPVQRYLANQAISRQPTAFGAGLPAAIAGQIRPGAATPQYYSDQLPAGLTQQDVNQALYGPGWENIPGSPEFNARQTFYPNNRVNPAGWDAFMASGPMSTNIEDRRALSH